MQSTFNIVLIINTISMPQYTIITSELNMLAILANADPVTTIVYSYDATLTPYSLVIHDGMRANTPPLTNELNIMHTKYNPLILTAK
jgi:hypothetical protein